MEPKNFSLFTSRLHELKHRIKVSCIENNINQSNIKILAVSKKKNLNDVKNAIANGLKNFGENFGAEDDVQYSFGGFPTDSGHQPTFEI